MKTLFFSACALILTALSCTKDSADAGDNGIASKTIPDVAYGTDALQKMDVYLPANRSTTTTKVFILIHGGAWASGDKSDANFVPYIDTLKKRFPDYAIFNINYRLAAFPATNTFPAQELDIKAAVEFIYGNRSTYLISDKFVMLGASAGAHLALLQAYKYHSVVNVKAVVDFFGPTDMSDLYNNPGGLPAINIALLMNGTPVTNPTLYLQSSPITFANAQSCPTIILQGGSDPLVNATTQSVALKNKLTAATVVNEYVLYPAGGHGDWDVATYTDAFNRIQAFIIANVQ